jgi:GNAT superfamily N-acetyltransferase
VAEIRRATGSDVEAMIAMGRALHDESPRYRGMAYSPDKLRRLARRLAGTLLAEDAAMFVAFEGDEVIGMAVPVIAERFFSDERYVTDLTLYVKPEHRGGRVFFRLVRAVEDWARGQGVMDLALGVSTAIHPEATVHAYQRLGYTLDGYTLTKTLNHGD